ncbi:MAG: DUF4175 family protein [Planctomycetaceae bacterium]
MAEYRLAHRVGVVADRLQRLRSLQRRSRAWFCGAAAGLLILGLNWGMPSLALSGPLTMGAGLLLLVGIWWVARWPCPSLHEAALAIEQRWPSLDSRLVTAIDQRPGDGTGGFSYLQHEVISETLLHAHRHDWRETVPLVAIARARVQQFVSLCGFFSVFGAAAWLAHARSAPPAGALTTDVTGGSARFAVAIEPGDAVIERGTSLLVIARFAERMPADVVLHATDDDGTTTSLPLSRSLDDPLFGGRIPSVETGLSYHVTFDTEQSDAYRVQVFDYPRLEQADATIVHPEYTGLGEKTIADVRRVSVVEGSQLTLHCRLNKPVAEAVLQAEDDSELKLSAAGDDAAVQSITFTPREKQKLKLILVDAEGRLNQQPPEFVIDVIPNRPPELSVTFPGKDARVSPLEEVSLEANAQDDFGLQEYGLIYQLPDRDEQSLKLGDVAAGEAKVALSHQLAMEDVAAQPNELVAYYFYADDVGPDGGRRRTFSDMYFTEVRYFDEEFRQAEAQQGQPGQMPSGAPSDQMLQVQRDIVNAIWNLIRRERGEQPSAEFPDDARTVAESQQQAIDLGRQLQSTQEDSLAQQYLEDALEQMALAEESLSAAAGVPSAEPLPPARGAAYAAYQALVKLNVREHLVQQSQSQSSSQSGRSASDMNRQLQQLELDNKRNRYETEQQDEPPADREQLQVLNRLRELARRQSGLNEKIRELESALREAQTPDERTEIERQLKRLQEEEQQLLRDLDELNERMNNEENRSRMADAREQAQNVREHLLRTSEALKEGQTSRALASGTRAERELNELKDELREQTAGQFADTMRELRQEARELADQEQQLAQELAGETREDLSGPPKLTDGKGDDLPERFKEQQERVNELMDKLKDVIEAAEPNEPLLSKTLYDAVRDTRTDRPVESLEMAGQFLRYGLKREAAQAETQARAGIDKLREGIEHAAESVLGNEVESLRRAEREIDELSRAIGSELAQANPQGENPDSPQGRASGKRSPDHQTGRAEPVESNDAPPGEESPGRRPGESPEEQRGERRPGSSPSPGEAGEQSDPAPSDRSQSGEAPPGQPSGRSAPDSPNETDGGRETPSQRSALSNFLPSDSTEDGGGTGPGGLARPLTGGDFPEWSDRMRDVEEMVDDPDLRARAAQIRDRARQVRIDVKQRHSESPNWELVRTGIYGPMRELRDRLAEEIARRESSDQIVPLDRDPVPDRYADLVEQYYERLGSGR